MVAGTQPAVSTQALAQECVAFLRGSSVYFQGHHYWALPADTQTQYLQLAGKVFDSLTPAMQSACSRFVGDRFDLSFKLRFSSLAWAIAATGVPLLFIPANAPVSAGVSLFCATRGRRWIIEGSQDYLCRRDAVIKLLATKPDVTEQNVKVLSVDYDVERIDWMHDRDNL